MKSKAAAVSDFYHQLALLVESNFPMPECLQRLAGFSGGKALRKVVEQIRSDIGNGGKLSDAMAAHPDYFEKLHVRLISVGESTDSLSEVLKAVAEESRFEQFVVTKAKEILTYPLFVLNMAVILFVVLSIFFMPIFQMVYSFNWQKTPILIAFALKVSVFVSMIWPLIVIVLGLLLVVAFWLYSGSVRAHRAAVWILDRIPGTSGVTRILDSARICGMCRLFLQRCLPVVDALSAAATVVQRPSTRSALLRVAGESGKGGKLAELLCREDAIDSRITYTFRNKPEDQLVSSLDQLRIQYEEDLIVMTRDAAAAWTVLGVVVMTAAVIFMALMVFVPVMGLGSALGS